MQWDHGRDKGLKMIHIAESEQAVWDAYLISAVPHVILELAQRAPEQIAERAAEIADEMLAERRERRPQSYRKIPI
jgi:hypothetical protein